MSDLVGHDEAPWQGSRQGSSQRNIGASEASLPRFTVTNLNSNRCINYKVTRHGNAYIPVQGPEIQAFSAEYQHPVILYIKVLVTVVECSNLLPKSGIDSKGISSASDVL